jgi:hypothetical protein
MYLLNMYEHRHITRAQLQKGHWLAANYAALRIPLQLPFAIQANGIVLGVDCVP